MTGIDSKPLTSHEPSTRQRLLDVASQLFAQKGFKSTTVAEISTLAHANIAAVNYHFGSKEDLYAEAWRQAFLLSQQIYPIHGNLPADAPPKERLRATIYSLLHRVMDTGKLGHAGQLLLREMGQQSVISRDIRSKVIEPIRKHVSSLIVEFLGQDVPRDTVALCTFSFISQCLSIGFKGGKMPLEFANRPVTDELVDQFAEHILEFTLAGLSTIRLKYQPSSEHSDTP
jgi:AcrR family transcriptional regulator